MKVPEPPLGSRTPKGSKTIRFQHPKKITPGIPEPTKGLRTIKCSRIPGKLQTKRPRSRFGTNPHKTSRKVIRDWHLICQLEF